MMPTRFGLEFEGRLLSFYTESNEGADFCCSVAFTLDDSSDNVWLVEDRETAERAAVANTEWFNASYNTPMNPFAREALRVVEVTLTF
jgi:hypothetical protein